MTGKVRRVDLLTVFFDVLVNSRLMPSVSVTVILIPDSNTTGGTEMMNVVGSLLS